MKKPYNTRRYGIWIDHSKAVVLCADEQGAWETQTFQSGIRSHLRYRGESTDKTGLFRHTLQPEKHVQNRQHEKERKFFREVARSLTRVSAVLILGPGEVRHGLEHELRRRKALNGAWIENRPADKMQLPAFKAAVKEHYHL